MLTASTLSFVMLLLFADRRLFLVNARDPLEAPACLPCRVDSEFSDFDNFLLAHVKSSDLRQQERSRKPQDSALPLCVHHTHSKV